MDTEAGELRVESAALAHICVTKGRTANDVATELAHSEAVGSDVAIHRPSADVGSADIESLDDVAGLIQRAATYAHTMMVDRALNSKQIGTHLRSQQSTG